MGFYMVTTENVEDGIWLDEPETFASEAEAKEGEAKMRPPPAGHLRILYRCNQISTLRAAND